ncbi:hypothetical protein FXN61_17400 [Lentzea sp. PSKA42]|uniref:Clp amino terminal domain-containing protein, pathogenicity island component n=1 Tax=Lentzea indica TaxID=2604800 RepID=A0ABX1FIR4_9PSEU|nr:hypothetical protein [Lentzea indica]NKE58501.1 hypothetical protein [Lentzea indica]
MNSITCAVTPSRELSKVLIAAVRRAAKLEFGFVGTENLLIALADSGGAGRALGRNSLGRNSLGAYAAACGTENWAGDDGGTGGVPDANVTALLRAAHDQAGLAETALPESEALRACLRQAIADAGDGVLTTTHVSLALLRLGFGRAADLFTVRRFDVEAAISAVGKASGEEEAPAVWLLRKAGALEGESGRGYVRWLTGFMVRGRGLGGPMLVAVHNEASRLAVAAGRPEPTALDLVAAVLTLDHQLTVSAGGCVPSTGPVVRRHCVRRGRIWPRC